MGNLYPAWLADAARLTGAPVVEVAGWRSRGHGGMRVVEGVVAHHTAGPRTGNYPSLNVVTNGRAGLAGPLSAFGLGRDGTIYVIAAGTSWHAGASTAQGFTDLNDEFYGIEAESAGSINDWTPAQLDVYPRLVAAILYYIRRGSSRVVGHKECALPRGRKPDPAFIDMNAFRAQVAAMLLDPLNRIPKFANPKPTLPTPKKRLPLMIERQISSGDTYSRIVCPTGSKVSELVERAWVSISLAGGGEFAIAFQYYGDTDGPAPGTRPVWEGKIRNGQRLWQEIPNGTEFLEIWTAKSSAGGSVLIEQKPR